METLLSDLRYGARMLAKARGLTALAVAALAIGIGANAAVFSLVNAVLLRPLPGIGDPQRVVTIGLTDARSGTEFDNSSYPNFRDLREQNSVFSGVTAVHGLPVSVSGGGPAQREMAQIVAPNFFHVLDVPFAAGHGFSDKEDFVAAHGPEVVISYALWKQRFGGDSGVIGQTISINGQPMIVVGVAGRGFQGTLSSTAYDVWLPMSLARTVLPKSFHMEKWLGDRDAVWIMLYARLKPGVSVQQAQANVDTIAARIRMLPGVERANWIVMRGIGLDPEAGRDLAQMSGMLLGVVGLLLLLACANVANLLLARATARRRELAVRLALGAERRRLVRQLLTESALLALIGGAAGLALSYWATSLLARLFSPDSRFPLAVSLAPDGRVLLFAMAVSAVAAIAFGIAPALQGSKADLFLSLKEAVAASPRRGRLRPLLVGVQLALSLILLVGAGLLVRTIRNFNAIQLGFDPRDLMMMSVEPTITGHYDDPARLRLFHQQLLQRIESIPGVESATFGRVPPLSRSGWGMGAHIPDKPKSWVENHGWPFNSVAPNYFSMMGIRIVQGRGFGEQDNASAPLAAVINETAASMLWPGEDPLGKQFFFADSKTPYHVIGVVQDLKYFRLLDKPRPFLYVSMWQPYPVPEAPTVIHIRTRLPLAEIATEVQREVQALDPDLPVFDARSASQQIADSYWQQRLTGLLVSIFAVLALALGMVGMYGVMAYVVSERTREVGIRMALGAQPRDVLRLMLSEALRITAAALVVGALAAFALARVLSSLLYGVSPHDPLTFAAVAALLAAVALAASYLPARRATAVDPMVALRYE